MTPKIGISESNLKKSASRLSTIFADDMTLYVKSRKFHSNIVDNTFMELHKLFYTELEEVIDEVEERINKSGNKTIGIMKEFSKLSNPEENENNHPIHKELISELLKDHEILIVEIRKDIDACSDDNHDAGLADILTTILQQHETMAWILRRYLN